MHYVHHETIHFTAAPMLLEPQVHDVVENSTIEINILKNDPFPPVFQVSWYCGDLFLQSNLPIECLSCGLVTVLPGNELKNVLKIESVDKACSGKQFQYTVMNTNQMTSFTLNVLCESVILS